jgi:hypothetical protein
LVYADVPIALELTLRSRDIPAPALNFALISIRDRSSHFRSPLPALHFAAAIVRLPSPPPPAYIAAIVRLPSRLPPAYIAAIVRLPSPLPPAYIRRHRSPAFAGAVPAGRVRHCRRAPPAFHGP